MNQERTYSKKVLLWSLVMLSVFSLTACQSFSENTSVSASNPSAESSYTEFSESEKPAEQQEGTAEDMDMQKIEIVVGDRSFSAKLYHNETAQAFAAMLPLTLTMNELNGNEKYHNLSQAMPTNASRPSTVYAGDLMLFGSDCLVLFYESFSTSYSYTALGRIEDAEGFAEAVGDGSVTVTFQQVEDSSAPVFNFETKTVHLNSGYDMPIAGLGTYALSDETCFRSVTALLENGGRLIDTAYMYGNEASVGRAIRESGVPREEIFVTTKLYPNQFSNAEAAINEALEKMDIEYIDLMLLHHPGTGDVAAYEAMKQAVRDGKLRSIGLSNWYIEELEEFLPQITVIPAVVQNEIHPYYQEKDVVPFIQDLGIVVEGWFPFGGRGHTAELLGDEVISAIAAAHDVTSAQVILRWNLQRGVVVIPGSSNPDHIKENLDIFGFELTDEEMERIAALDRGEKHEWY